MSFRALLGPGRLNWPVVVVPPGLDNEQGRDLSISWGQRDPTFGGYTPHS